MQEADQYAQTQNTQETKEYVSQPVGDQQSGYNAIVNNSVGSLTLYQKFWMGITSIVMLVLALTYFPRLMMRPAQITAIGIGEVDFQPDEVSMVVTNVTTGVNSTNTITQGDADLQTLIFTAKNISPDIEVSKSFYQTAPASLATGQRIYQTANAFSIKSSDVDQASRIVQALYADGATSVSNVTFSSTNKEAIEQEAREKAVADAKMKAKEIASAAGKRLGRMVAISDDYSGASSTVSKSGGTGTGADNNGADFSNVSINKAVSIVYEIW